MQKNLVFKIILILFLISPSVLFADEIECNKSPNCGISPDDWCCTTKSDPCSKHKNKDSCMKDNNCEGVRYHGESVIACQYDARNFNGNCPTVGCRSRCKESNKENCFKE